MTNGKKSLAKLRNIISKEGKTVRELNSLFNYLENADAEERNMVFSQIKELRNFLEKTNEDISKTLEKISLATPLVKKQEKKSEIPRAFPQKKKVKKVKIPKRKLVEPELFKPQKKIIRRVRLPKDFSDLEKGTLKRLKKKEKKIIKKKTKKPSKYIETANKIFADFSRSLLKRKMFSILGKDLIKTNLQFTPQSYISTILFSTLLSAIAGVFIFLFFLFFNLGADLPIITKVTENIGI